MERAPLQSLCAAIARVTGIDAPSSAASYDGRLTGYAASVLGDRTADRVFMYNPDAIAEWIADKYAPYLREVTALTDLRLPYRTVMPSVTPVCFGTMYTGASPEVHGIQAYVKPVITIDTLFDALIRAGRRPAIVCTAGDSLSKIYLERKMDYFFYRTIEEVNAKAAELILEDRYDFIVVYNGNYDSVMHKFGPESPEALAELRCNSRAFAAFCALIREHWQDHDTLVGFAMDHGCHGIDGGCGSHGLDMPEDMLIAHHYKIYPRREE